MTTLRPNAKDWVVKEQIVEDAVTGLFFQFEKRPTGHVLRIFGERLPLGNRDLFFDGPSGECNGSGIGARGLSKPAWSDPL